MSWNFKDQLRCIDHWWGRWMVPFGHASLDVRAAQYPGCAHAGLRRRQLFQPNQPQNSGRCDAECGGAFTDGHLAAGLPLSLTVDRNRMVVAQRADTLRSPDLSVCRAALIPIQDRGDPRVWFDPRQHANDLHEIIVGDIPMPATANLLKLYLRRDAEEWIVQGGVTANGRVINSPALDVTANDVITVDGKPLPPRERTRLFMFHKPRGLMTTHADPEGRPTVFDNLPEGLPRLISIGRLDFNTEGLLLLTNDGGLARVLELPDTGWLRRYRVRAHGEVTQAQLDELKKGVEVDGVKYGPIDATLERDQGANVWLVFAIREGKNREVRNVLAHLGLEVNRLIRVSYGPVQLGGQIGRAPVL